MSKKDPMQKATKPTPERPLHDYVTEVSDRTDVRVGVPLPLGTYARGKGVNFAFFSRHASRVRLELFDHPEDAAAARVIDLDPVRNRTGDVWHVWIEGIPPGQLYAYRVDGPYQPKDGHRFNFNKLLLDPFATAISPLPDWDFGPALGYDPSAQERDLVCSKVDDAGAMPKCVFTHAHFHWHDDRPLRHPWSKTVIYETHVRGFTIHANSGVEHPGTYRGLMEKIPYLKELGVTAVELMPVYEFNQCQAPGINPQTAKPLRNYWGYDPVAFFAPKASYSSAGGLGQQQLEFKEMVQAFHRAGIEVILDVVFNHTAEGNEQGPTLCFRGIDNTIFYILADDKRFYKDYTGTGNTINANHPVVRDHILAALRYWMAEMHVDGFRFDLASVLGRDGTGKLLANAPLLERIAEDPILGDVKIIAEAWDAAGAYEVGSFSEWRRCGRFRSVPRVPPGARWHLAVDGGQMKKSIPITTWFLDIGGVLPTNRWEHPARKRAANFKLGLDEIEDRHHLTFDTYEEGKLTLEEYFGRVGLFPKTTVHPGSVSALHACAIETLPRDDRGGRSAQGPAQVEDRRGQQRRAGTEFSSDSFMAADHRANKRRMMMTSNRNAPGGPGIQARWTSSAKTGVGTALRNNSHVWFTLSHGIFNEIYYPRIDQACVRDMGLIVTDGADFFSEEKTGADSGVHWLADGVPAFRLVNTCRDGRYRIEKQIVTDPHRDTVLQQVRFIAQQGALSGYHLYVLLAPHLGNRGGGNTAWVDEFAETSLLFAQRNGNALALACSVPWTKRSVGYVGSSDGWQDLKAHKQMTWEYDRAENGNVALTAGIDLFKSQGDFVLALGFGNEPEEAARNAIASLRDGFDKAKHDYIAGWQEWTKTHATLKKSGLSPGDLSRISLAVLRTHESKTAPGGLIASLSIPWGFSKGDDDLGGYHLVWSRDMVETAGGLIAAGAHEDARRVLSYLQATQQPDGHWSQNMWLDGSPYWDGIQMDETALPIFLVDMAHREKALAETDMARFWPMVRQAAGYLARNGPVSPEDRWEEDPGYSPFTVGAEIAALLAAADLADLNHEASIATYLREIADVWNTSIERWMYVSGTDWCRKFNVEGYYVRIAPIEMAKGVSRFQEIVHVKNVPAAYDTRLAKHLVSPDALALVRFGLRAADDPRIRDTAKVIDALLKVETPSGPTWHRYNDDGYGEHEDGAPFDGTGIGRGWPLLTGERAHYELAAGRVENAKRLLAALESFANEGGLIPEQVWDSPDIPERELHFGRPSGSAMPLVWAHAEYLKLRRSLRDGRLFDLPPQPVKRYLTEKTVSPRMVWRFNHKIRWMPAGKILRIETMAPAVIHWSADDWITVLEDPTQDVGLGIHFADLSTKALAQGKQIIFTFYWPDADHWEGADFMVRIGPLRRDGPAPSDKE